MENGMEQKFRYGIWKMPEWNGIFQEWNGRQSSILPYQFHTRFRALYLQKNTYQCRVVIKYCHRSIQLQYLRILFGDKLRYRTLVVYIAQTVYDTYCIIVSTLQFNCSTDVTVDEFFFCFEADNLPSCKFCFLTSRKLVFAISSLFPLILFIFLVFNLMVILFGVKAWYFYYDKCSS